MEQLSVLEKKLMMLIESKKKDAARISELCMELEMKSQDHLKLSQEMESTRGSSQDEMVRLMEENEQLKKQVEKLEDTLLVRHQSIEGLNQEREFTKMAVDDLIKSIDILVEQESLEQESQQ